MYYFYILRCADNTLYCGQTNNLARRIVEHNTGKSRSAKYLKARRPVELVYHEQYRTLGEALRRELEVKSWKKIRKEDLVCGRLKLLKTRVTLPG